jgi:hypothetical protein
MGLFKRSLKEAKGMLKKSIICVAVFLFMFSGSSLVFSSTLNRAFLTNNIPQPVLKEPVTDKVDLSGESELVFRWSPHEGSISQRKHYDFRLYEGYQMVESNLIFQNNVAPNQHQIAVNSGMFKNGQVYTWSLRQTYRSGKSQRSTSSFTVTGK